MDAGAKHDSTQPIALNPPLPPPQELRAHKNAICYTLLGLMTATFTLLFLTMLIFTSVSGMFKDERLAVYAWGSGHGEG